MPNKSVENQPKPPKLPEEQTGNLDQSLNDSVEPETVEKEGEDSLNNAIDQINQLEQENKS